MEIRISRSGTKIYQLIYQTISYWQPVEDGFNITKSCPLPEAHPQINRSDLLKVSYTPATARNPKFQGCRTPVPCRVELVVLSLSKHRQKTLFK